MARRITNGDEEDVHPRWRHMLACMKRPGVAKKTKRRTNRRERQEGKTDARRQCRDMDR